MDTIFKTKDLKSVTKQEINRWYIFHRHAIMTYCAVNTCLTGLLHRPMLPSLGKMSQWIIFIALYLIQGMLNLYMFNNHTSFLTQI